MSSPFKVAQIATAMTVTAPDGSEVKILSASSRGSMARFTLAPGLASKAVKHRTVEELWYFTSGRGEMWLANGAHEEIIPVAAGHSLAIPVGTAFQFRSFGGEPLEAIGVTMPPWPGMDEAEYVPGKWSAMA